MADHNAEVTERNRFRWGILLAWIPLMFFIVPTAIAIIYAFVSMGEQRATGLGAVAGGVSEVLVTFGLVVLVASEVAATVMLLRSLSRSHPLRSVAAIISACCGILLLSVIGLFLWFSTTHHWR